MNFEKLPIELYQQQLSDKKEKLQVLLEDFGTPDIELFESPVSHYRMRAEFRIWHEGNDIFHIMFDKKTKSRIKLDQYPVASKLINQIMPVMISYLKDNLILRFRLFQIDYLSTQSGKLLVSLLYHKPLTDEWAAAIEIMKRSLNRDGFDIEIVGRAHKQKMKFNHDYIDEVFVLDDKPLIYRQVENSFTQPNAVINQKMLQWARSVTLNSQGSLLELYCGNGNFSLALADNFRSVLATEIAKSSVQAAQYNIAVNQIKNVNIIRLSAEEFTQAINGERVFKRLSGIDLSDYKDCNTILVDPPRSGLDQKSLQMIQGYSKIIYISCNPNTLVDNLAYLTQSHYIKNIALFDQFPYTEHIETGVVLEVK
ncbi:tRNA (uridine(54)-C5)-methyltransferase TrmA [Thorsellia anophelis]|uniref:tRNA/tmRNA (uracil-C(5))-methyltransferase n=1 Tax=Thorsellia anophelis DSM 18579 TaxID=1123402 RepID=A0A1I0DPZ3_9GAMM|nr:tRNA (uridine(54)-C5)-methyltransferase TrmA [Thorsellia anophelis]SET33801.1 tRNA (uracil-5-)-methyltransferase [Thorsellia anophelis DSM 18579]